MLEILRTEHLKFKRTFAKRLALFTPFLFILISQITKLYLPDEIGPWELLLYQIYNWWPVLFVPLGTALLASLAQQKEKRAGNLQNLRIHPVSVPALWTGKIAVLACHTLLSSGILAGSLLLAGLIVAGGAIPWSQIVTGALLIWLTSLALIPIQLWAAAWKGTLFSMAVGFAGLIAGVLAAPTPHWVYVPWSWPTRLMAPVVGVHPNGVPLDAGDPLLEPSVIPVGILLGITAFLLFTWITALWFKRKEMR
jgi:lantibiotic protection ABC transporter MutE/EpiE family permease subunit